MWAKIGRYLVYALIVFGLGFSVGYKLGAIIQKDKDKDSLDRCVQDYNKLQTESAINAKNGQTQLTEEISKAKDAEQKSKKEREALLAKAQQAESLLKKANAATDRAEANIPTCGLRSANAQLVNQLLEKSNETGYFAKP